MALIRPHPIKYTALSSPAYVLAQPIGGLQVRDAWEDADLAAHPPETVAFPTAPTLNRTAAGVPDLKGATKKDTDGRAESWPHNSTPYVVLKPGGLAPTHW